MFTFLLSDFPEVTRWPAPWTVVLWQHYHNKISVKNLLHRMGSLCVLRLQKLTHIASLHWDKVVGWEHSSVDSSKFHREATKPIPILITYTGVYYLFLQQQSLENVPQAPYDWVARQSLQKWHHKPGSNGPWCWKITTAAKINTLVFSAAWPRCTAWVHAHVTVTRIGEIFLSHCQSLFRAYIIYGSIGKVMLVYLEAL